MAIYNETRMQTTNLASIKGGDVPKWAKQAFAQIDSAFRGQAYKIAELERLLKMQGIQLNTGRLGEAGVQKDNLIYRFNDSYFLADGTDETKRATGICVFVEGGMVYELPVGIADIFCVDAPGSDGDTRLYLSGVPGYASHDPEATGATFFQSVGYSKGVLSAQQPGKIRGFVDCRHTVS